LEQVNGAPVDTTSSAGTAWPNITAVGGTLSSGETLPAASIDSQFVSRAPGSVSVNGVKHSTRGFVPASFDTLLNEESFSTLDFGNGASVHFSGGNNGTYSIAVNTFIEGQAVFVRLGGTYRYSVSGTNQNLMTFSLSFDTLFVSAGSTTFSGTLYDLANMAGEILPVRITASAEYTSLTTGNYTLSLAYTNGQQESYSGTFDDRNGLDFGFL
jgi:hypothetical protein